MKATMRLLRFAALVICGMAFGLGKASAAKSLDLAPFTKVLVCSPVSVKVAPSTSDSNYSVQIDAEDSVVAALQANVANGKLSLETKAAFTTSAPIRVMVLLPPGKLQAVATLSPADVAIAPGFSVPQLALNSAGSGTLAASGVTASSLTVESTG